MIVANEKVRHLRYESLRRQLKEEDWPMTYRHKVIGRYGDNFAQGIRDLQSQFPKLSQAALNVSAKGNYLSVTFEMKAEDVDEVIRLWLASEDIPDCLQVL